MANIKKARIVYNKEADSFDIEINTGDGWGLETSYPCRRSANKPDAEEAEFISWRILEKIKLLKLWGYEIKVL